MDSEPKDPVEDAPAFIAETQAALREGMERAHELVAEAKLAMRQMSNELDQPLPE